jgi:hypothetical protein
MKRECGVEQLVARRAHNPKATGSSPVPATKEERRSDANQAFFYILFLASRPRKVLCVRKIRLPADECPQFHLPSSKSGQKDSRPGEQGKLKRRLDHSSAERPNPIIPKNHLHSSK